MAANAAAAAAAANVAGPAANPAGGGQAAAAVMPAVVPPVFMVSPWDQAVIIDFSTTEGRKLFQTGVAPILPKFVGLPTELLIFLTHLSTKGMMLGWTDAIFRINIGTAAAPVFKNLIGEYGQITVAQCRAKAIEFLADAAGNRETQMSYMLQMCLASSIADDLYTQVLMRKAEYTVTDHAGRPVLDGATMLRIVLSIVCPETRATVSIIRERLTKLPAKLAEIGSDIRAFNVYVNLQIMELFARGYEEQPEAITGLLLKAYVTAQDEAFARYMTDYESRWEDMSLAITPEALMVVAENKYKSLVEKGTWHAVPKVNEQMVILQAVNDALEKKLKSWKNKADKQSISRDNGTPPGNTPKKKNWKHVAPKAGEPTSRTAANGKDYVYCPNHKELKWVLKEGHAGGCTLDGKDATKKQTKKEQYAQALAHVHDDEEDEESGEEDENL